MSGGYFDYRNYYLNDIADRIRSDLAKMRLKLPYYDFYPDDFVALMSQIYEETRVLSAKLRRLDWVLSGDDDPEDYAPRLAQDLAKLGRLSMDDPSEDEDWAHRESCYCGDCSGES